MTALLALLLLQPSAAAETIALKVGDVERTAIVYAPPKGKAQVPVVFVFHGFTGSARQAAFSYRMHEAWKEVVTVYPQGLDVDLLGRTAPGWQVASGLQGDRDLAFYDALLAKVLKDRHGDPKRVYTCGMSNGAIFSYLLVAKRGTTLAGAATVGGFAPIGFAAAAPMPLLIVHGKNDELIQINSAERSRDAALKNNKLSETTSEWAPGFVRYGEAKSKTPVVWNAHDGGHEWPTGTSEAIVKFFKSLAG